MNEMLPLLLIAGFGLLAYKEGWLSNLMSSATPAATTILPAAGSPLASPPVQNSPAILTPPGSPVQTIQPVVVGTTTPTGTVLNPAYVQATPDYAPAQPPARTFVTDVGPVPTSPGQYVMSTGAAGRFGLDQVHDMLAAAVGPEFANSGYWGYGQWNALLEQLTGIHLDPPAANTGYPTGGLLLDGNSMAYAYWPWAHLMLQNMGLQGLGSLGWN